MWRARPSIISRTSRREGLNAGSGAPFQESTRTSIRSASSAKEVADDHRLLFARQRQLGREEPSGDVNIRLSTRKLRSDRGEHLRAIDENVESVPGPSWVGAVREVELGGVERALPPHPSKPSSMSVANGAVELVANRVSQLDRDRLERSWRLRGACDRVGRPRRAAGRDVVVVMVGHAGSVYHASHRPPARGLTRPIGF